MEAIVARSPQKVTPSFGAYIELIKSGIGLNVKVLVVTGEVKATLCNSSGNVEYKISDLVRHTELIVTLNVFTSF
jgi:hypothetical protein